MLKEVGWKQFPGKLNKACEGPIMVSELSNCSFLFNPEPQNAKSICFSSLDSSTDLATENCVGQKAWVALPGHRDV